MGRSDKTFIEVFLYKLTYCCILLLVQAKWFLNNWLKVWFKINGMIIGFSCREGSDWAFRKDCGKEIMKFLRNKVFWFLSSFLFAFDVLQILRFRHFVLYPLFSNIRRLSSKVTDWITSRSSCLSIHSSVSSCSFPGFTCAK